MLNEYYKIIILNMQNNPKFFESVLNYSIYLLYKNSISAKQKRLERKNRHKYYITLSQSICPSDIKPNKKIILLKISGKILLSVCGVICFLFGNFVLYGIDSYNIINLLTIVVIVSCFMFFNFVQYIYIIKIIISIILFFLTIFCFPTLTIINEKIKEYNTLLNPSKQEQKLMETKELLKNLQQLQNLLQNEITPTKDQQSSKQSIETSLEFFKYLKIIHICIILSMFILLNIKIDILNIIFINIIKNKICFTILFSLVAINILILFVFTFVDMSKNTIINFLIHKITTDIDTSLWKKIFFSILCGICLVLILGQNVLLFFIIKNFNSIKKNNLLLMKKEKKPIKQINNAN